MSQGYVQFFGNSLFRVVTGSMEPTISTGALMITREVDINTIALNDIVCFRTQEAAIWGKIVTHRVVEILEAAGITVAYFDVSDFEEYLKMLDICTDITGRKDLYETNGLEVKKQIERAVKYAGGQSYLLLRASATYIRAKNRKLHD